MRNFNTKLCLLIFALASHSCLGQVRENYTPPDTLEIAKDYYLSGAYSRSITTLETLLPYLEGNPLIEAHVYLALNYVVVGDKASAIEHFKSALTWDPDLQLDAYGVTPDIMAVYDDARKEKAYESAGCSCFIPGIGQILKGDDRKGRAIIAASVITLAGTLISWSIADSKHTAYLSLGPEDIDKMDSTYDEYNRWRKITILSGAAFAGIYMYSIFDAVMSRKQTQPQTGVIFKYDGNNTQFGYAIGI
jgi:tetratricopeptide (TPR) repeat protein